MIAAAASRELTDVGVVQLVREIFRPCLCERGSRREECRVAPLDRSWITDLLLDFEQNAALAERRRAFVA